MGKCVPVDFDRRPHNPAIAISRRVDPGLPECISVRVDNLSVVDPTTGYSYNKRRTASDEPREGDTVGVFSEYFGGLEGDSLIRWYRMEHDGTVRNFFS